MEDKVSERKFYGTYERLNELKKMQDVLLSFDLHATSTEEEQELESSTFQRFSTEASTFLSINYLDEYQEQSYLMDPYLENLVAPVVGKFKSYVKTCLASPTEQGNVWRADRVASMLYRYVKFRGYKTIIRFFPHEISDLSIALEFTQIPNSIMQDRWHWAVRYVMLLWLYIICLIPFDLSQFDEADNKGHTARTLETAAKSFLGTAGLEREAAALLLSRLYIRKDTVLGFHDFAEEAYTFLKNDNTNPFKAIGLLHVLCEVMKSGSVDQVQDELPTLLSISRVVQQSTYSKNNVIRKFRTKLISRIGLRLLPTSSRNTKRKARTLSADDALDTEDGIQEDIDVPSEIEDILEQIFAMLQDSDTIVRWSAAKGVARIAQRLPKDFCSQVLETVMGLFEIHSAAAASIYDLPAVAEATWHGACLACAEMARRSLVEPEHLPQLIGWLSKALYFDLRKGAHSIGSNVRDSAAYVLWALARTQNKSALIPHATNLAQRLTAVALYDREVHIRRAASAAFQEHVGRTSLFPHGIDVLGKTDFYAVSIRKHAFLVAAPQVAVHPEYRNFLFDHILDVVLRHWDQSMRELGSQSLRLICSHDLDVLAPRAMEKYVPLLESLDTSDVHGALLGLREIAIAYKEKGGAPAALEENLRSIFRHLNYVNNSDLTTTRNDLVASAACHLIGNSITVTEINLGACSSVPSWKKIVEIGLKHRSATVQEAAADAMSTISNLTDLTPQCLIPISMTFKLIPELKSGSPIMQQSLARLLGVINYKTHLKILPEAIKYLLDSVKPTSKTSIETRRICFQAVPSILSLISPKIKVLSSNEVNSLVDALLGGLDDYTIDERGDVGSWVRIACMQGLTTVSELFFGIAQSIPDFESYFPPQKYWAIAAGLLKQGVERLDNVRQTAGSCFMRLLNESLPDVNGADQWSLPALPLLKQLFINTPDQPGWNDGSWLFPRVIRLLEVPEYRKHVLAGIVISIGSKTDSTRKPVSSSLVEFAQELPVIHGADSAYSLLELVNDLIGHAKSNMTSNAIVVPVFQTFTVLLEADVLRHLSDEASGMQSLKTLAQISSRNVTKLKSVQRIHECMKIVVNLFTFKQIRDEKISLLIDFLGHPFPKVRSETAEYIYVVLQSADIEFETDAIEDILLETEWSAIDREAAQAAADEVVKLFEA
ncbi:TBCD protein [Gymnopilus junonius]|uniref:TBCD protein n=1 Tax=Gymnopilus junonius TaxID=109634 RepID=A0A9P5NXK7_GYMJU|nr:TBCD protein [Gymnopilus junonius]